MKNTLMVDLETTGKRPGCCILSIGAVGISKNGEKVIFYSRISYKGSKDEGFEDNPETIAWWKNRDEEARREAFGGTDDESPEKIVREFVAFVEKNFNTGLRSFSVWSKGSDFDFPILNAYLDAYELATPWPFWSQRDYRTLQAVFPFIKAEEKNSEKHNALEDARAQMRGLEYFVTLEAIFKEKPNKVKTIMN